MAKAPKPIMSKKGSPPSASATVGNLNKAEPRESVPLNFKVPRQFRRDFKTWAAQHDMTLNRLLQESFRCLQERDTAQV